MVGFCDFRSGLVTRYVGDLLALIPIGLSGRRRLILRGLAAGCPRLGVIVGLPANVQPLGVVGRIWVGLLGPVELVRLRFDIGLVGLTAAGFIGLIPVGPVDSGSSDSWDSSVSDSSF